MLLLHALLAFLFCASAVALPGLPARGSKIPDIPPNAPKGARGRYCRFTALNGTPVLKEHMNDVMILRDEDGRANGELGMVGLRQLTDTPGVLAGGQVLRTTTELSRLKGDWIRFPTGDIHDKDHCEMVHVDVGPGLVITCGRLVEGGSWKEVLLTAAIGHYYNSKALNEPLTDYDSETVLKGVLLVEQPRPQFIPQFLLLNMPDDHERGTPLQRLVNVGIDEIKDDKWIPFPVAIRDVRKVETRNQVFCFMTKPNGQQVARFRSLRRN